jgi:hypothetical protein
MEHSEYLPRIETFIESLGIKIVRKQLEETFLPGVDIGSGCIFTDPEKLEFPGDLLHEAGHLAVTTPRQRKNAGTELSEDNWPTDGEEIAAVLWSYAAALHIGVPPDVVFHSAGYRGSSQWLIDSFEKGDYIGLPFLEWAGMAFSAQRAAEKGVKPFPAMVSWLREEQIVTENH